MKIKRAPKRYPSTHPAIAAFVLSISASPQDELPNLLQPILSSGWTWPRTDLQHWIVPLNRFDLILEEVINDYDLSSMEHCQRNAFTPRTKELLTSILSFQKLLLENSTNRKIFSSFDRLNDLLQTTDVSILLATLRLSLRPAQQYSSSGGAGLSTFAISERRLLNLAQGWGTREYGLEMVDLVADDLEIPVGLEEFEWQFYKKAPTEAELAASGGGENEGGVETNTEKKDKGKEVDAMETEDEPVVAEASTSNILGTPAPKPRATFAQGSLLATPIPATPGVNNAPAAPIEGLTNVVLGNVRKLSKTPVDILIDAVETFGIPVNERLNLLQKIRIAQSLSSAEDRRTLLVVRLLAIAVFAHSTSESSAQSKLFLYEPELITQLAELIHPDRIVPIEVQAAAFYALDALAKYKRKLGEVASAINASVSHGILMYVLRRTVKDLESDNPNSTPDFIDSLFNLLTFFHTNAFVGNMIIAAGVVPILVDFVHNKRPDRLLTVTRAVVFLDGLMYGYNSAFTGFIAATGVAIFVNRIKAEIELSIESYSSVASSSTVVSDSPTGLLSFEQAALVRALLRAIQRLMQTAGTTEGLRNLIDTTLLGSVKKIIQNRDLFGAQLFGLAINITATFVHNEPTCLATIQEANVPEALYDAIEESIPASIDVLQAIPNAVGALCLNPAGLAQFNARPIISKYFSIFSSERHVKILMDRDNGNMIGAAIDELVRHHPSLKDAVLAAVMESLKSINKMGKTFTPPTDEGYNLVKEVASESNAPVVDVEMSDAVTPLVVATSKVEETKPEEPKVEEQIENSVLTSIDVMGRFLEGLFQNLAHAKDFFKLEPLPLLLELLASPAIPSNCTGTSAFNSITSLFRIMSDVKAAETVKFILKQISKSLKETEYLWNSNFGESKLSQMLAPTDETYEKQNTEFRSLSHLLSYVALLSDIYSNLTYNHGKIATAVLAVLATPSEAETILQLGQLYRSCTWESILLKNASAVTVPFVPTSIPVGESKAEESIESGKLVAETLSIVTPTPNPTSNSKALIGVVSGIPSNIVPFLQASIKLFVHRRSTDSAHRVASSEVAKTIANFMTLNLQWPESSDLSSNLAYSTLMIGATALLLFEDRVSSSGVQTLLFIAFEKSKGFEAFLKIYSKYQDSANDLLAGTTGTVDGKKAELGLTVVQVFAGLKTAVELLKRLSSHKTLLESSQTALLITREKNKASPDYFDPHALLVRLRAAILPVVVSTWEVSWIRQSPPLVVRSTVGTLINILRAEGETSLDPTTILGGARESLGGVAGMNALLGLGGGAFGAALGVGGGGGAPVPGPFVLDESRVTQLFDMGFPRSAAVTILTRYRNNVGLATEYLLQRPDLVATARDADAAQAVRDAAIAAAAPPLVPVEPVEPVQVEVPVVEAEDPIVSEDDDEALVAEDGLVVISGDGESENVTPFGAEIIAELNAMASAGSTSQSDDIVMASAESALSEVEKAIKATKDDNDKVKKELDQAREAIKPTFLSKALSLAEDYSDLVFDITSTFSIFNTTSDRTPSTLQPILNELVESIKPDSENKLSLVQEQAIATRLRVIALLAADATNAETINQSRIGIMEILVKLQKLYLVQLPSKESRPKWLATTMLVADSLFATTEIPKPSSILPEGVEVPASNTICQGPSWTEEKEGYFNLAMDVLEKGISDREVFLSTLRLLLILTRDHKFASLFAQRDGLRLLFSSFLLERVETKGCRSYAVMILRHVVEEKPLLLTVMEREIEGWFSQPRPKVADIQGFLRGASSIASRDIESFLEATKSTLKLAAADAPTHYHLGLINEVVKPIKSTDLEVDSAIKSPFITGIDEEVSIPMIVDELPVVKANKLVSSIPISSTVESAVHFLIAEIVEVSKSALLPTVIPPTVVEPITETSTIVTPTPTPVLLSKKDVDIPADIPMGDFFHTSFTLSALAELVSSYPSCKTSLLSYSTRRPAKDSVPHSAPKPRATFLYFLLNDLIPIGSIVPPHDFDTRKRANIAASAASLFVALCHDPEASAPSKDSAAEITIIRKAALDAIARAFKDATASTESTDIRYARLFALADLCYRMLTSRPYLNINAKPHDDTTMQLAKLMLEKNFAVILTNALADVDLNFPYVNMLINSILRPLEQLTKVVTKVGRASSTSTNRQRDEEVSSEDSFGSSDELEVDTAEEEAPDPYRNSALGMYEGELEPGHQEDAYMSGGSTEEYDEDDEMMEMEDGIIPGSDISDASDDEDEEGSAAFAEEVDMMSDDDDSDDEDDEDDDDDNDDDDSDDSDELELAEIEAAELELDAGDIEAGDLEGGDEEDEEVWVDEEDGEDGEIDEAGFFDPDGPNPIRDDDEDSDGADSDEEGMYLTGELEFDAEMTEQLANDQARGGGGFGWDSIGNGEGGNSRRNRQLTNNLMSLTDATMYGVGGQRGGPEQSTAAVHPLLIDPPANDNRQETATASRGTQSRTAEYDAWVQSIERMLGPGAGDALQELLNQHGISHLADPNQIRVGLAPGPDGGIAMVIDPSAAIQAAQAAGSGHNHHHHHRRPNPPTTTQSAPRASRVLTERINSTSELVPITTLQRWQEESRVTQTSVVGGERTARLVNHVINILHPAARLEAKETKEKAKKEEEALEAKRVASKKLEEEKEEVRRKEQVEKEERAKLEADKPVEAMETEPIISTPATQPIPEVTIPAPVAIPSDLQVVMDLARSLAGGINAPSTATPTPILVPVVEATPSPEPHISMDSVDAGSELEPVASGSGFEPEPESEPVARIMITINGAEVDITDTGIDPTFLEALPDDMREEVLNQHFREARNSGPPPVVPSQINSEFLDALPPELRAEVLRQEAAEARREAAVARAAEEENDSGEDDEDGAAGPMDIDPASFLASLDPQLRRAVLMEQDDGFLATLPANLIAEANVLREANNRRHAARNEAVGGVIPAAAAAVDIVRRRLPGIDQVTPIVPVKKPVVHREAIQLLDKSGLATLVRLLFFPQPLRKNALQKVLVNLCENSRTRTELISLLLTILQDGTRDVSAVDKSFSQMSLRASKSLGVKETPRRKVGLENPGGGLPQFPGESVPNLIAQRCLEALMFLVSSNDQSPLFFLTEQEITIGLGRRSSKKGKGKEKIIPSTNFPIVVLLSLLGDRPALLKTQSMMDSLTQLLSTITKSLSVLQKKPGEDVTKVEASTSTNLVPGEEVLAPIEGEVVPAAVPEAISTVVIVPDATLPSTSTEIVESKEKEKEIISPAEILLKSPPQISPTVLRLVVNVLDAGECSSKTFQQTLALIQNLSYLPEAREIISDELRSRAQSLSNLLLPDIDELLEAMKGTEEIKGVTLAKFTPASSLQAKLLRILKTIDWIHSPPTKTPTIATANKKILSPEEMKVSQIYESFNFKELWSKLSELLSGVEAKPELTYLGTVLLPMIESFLQTSKYALQSLTEPSSEVAAVKKIES